MNCLGKGNYVHFIALMASLGSLLTYGAYLAFRLLFVVKYADPVDLSDLLNGRSWPSPVKAWSDVFDELALKFSQNVRIGGVGMLAAFTAPLAWGMFFYHLYLVWAGMTTNETSKWADWRDDITDGVVYRAERPPIADEEMEGQSNDIEPFVQWPISSTQQLVVSEGGQPDGRWNGGSSAGSNLPTAGLSRISHDWRKVYSLADVENLYDLGFWDNLIDILET